MTQPAFNVLAPMDALLALAQGIPGVQGGAIGVQEDPGVVVYAFVTLGGFEVLEWAGAGAYQMRQRYWVTFGYTQDNQEHRDAETTAERTLASIVQLFVAAIYNERGSGATAGPLLGGTVSSIDDPDGSIADRPGYAQYSTREAREYPIVVPVVLDVEL